LAFVSEEAAWITLALYLTQINETQFNLI